MAARLLGQGDEQVLSSAAQRLLGLDWPPERCRRSLADPAFVAVVAGEGEEPAGFAYAYVLDRLHRTDLLLFSIDVAEGARRQGLGGALVERLKALCIERGYGEMWLVTNRSNTAAMRLYASAGGVREFDDVEMFVFPSSPSGGSPPEGREGG